VEESLVYCILLICVLLLGVSQWHRILHNVIVSKHAPGSTFVLRVPETP
jgi:hypothetical protein